MSVPNVCNRGKHDILHSFHRVFGQSCCIQVGRAHAADLCDNLYYSLVIHHSYRQADSGQVEFPSDKLLANHLDQVLSSTSIL